MSPPVKRRKRLTRKRSASLSSSDDGVTPFVQLARSFSTARLNLLGKLNPIHPLVGPWGTLCKIVHYYYKFQRLLGCPGKFLIQAIRLMLFAILMLPGFLPPFCRYLGSRQIRKNVLYGRSWRHQLDIYLPSAEAGHSDAPARKKAPVVVFVSGGAWMIGYKAWGWLMGQMFQQQGVLFIAPDYRNFPEANVDTMVEDVIRAVGWVFQNIEALGGDAHDVTLMGQSAGAHISALAMLEQATREFSDRKVPLRTGLTWSARSLRRWVGISGPYDIMRMVSAMRNRGVPGRVLRRLMNNDLHLNSPVCRVRDLVISRQDDVLQSLPEVHLFHGLADETCPWLQSKSFAQCLHMGGVSVQTKFYPDKSHTDPILEDPISGAEDELMTDLLQLLRPGHCIKEGIRSLQPRFLLRCARAINPF